MFEDMTFERILTRCLSRVPQTVDKREGAIIYDAIAPAAAELAILYSTLSTEMDRAFPDTATGIDLTNKAKERSIFRLAATKAVRKGVFQNSAGYMDIPVGARFSGGTVNYTAAARISQGVYQMTCEDAEVCLESRSENGGIQPAGYTREIGRGRLCALTPGHTLDVWEDERFQRLFTNAAEWCMKER